MGNQKSIMPRNQRNNIPNTEGTQGLMNINTEKNSKKNVSEIILDEKQQKKNTLTKTDTLKVLLNKNKESIKNNIYDTPTEKNEINNLNNNVARNSSINYNRLNKNMTEYNTFEINEKDKNSQNSYNSRSKIIKEKSVINPNMNLSKKQKKEYKKTEFSNITIVDNLSKYFPKNISKKEIKDMVDLALDGSIVDEPYDFIPGQNLTREQADKIGQIIFENINNNQKNNNYDIMKTSDYGILNQINVKIGMNELNKEIIERMFFQGNKISQNQSNIILKNLTKGKKNVKALFIEIL